ncbi:MBL fold metallo-hydrolase [Inhella gelatinilytica]|uniref:MBL fold metallo-hydrolase n=1 Tax=Inhella gelatinilytica TaxID=2795030 RepID=A0A931IWP1_9BURK|nr:MBL fold metallo-hydrolase [Inhella gelatinilytica]MBH9552013.1 MBL fold metallo-hydrolase [Inhella gelatinilytica]
MIFRQLFDPASSTYTYLLAEGGEAVLIDPVFEQVRRDAALLRELGLRLVATVETHVHADHITGAALLRRRLGCQVMGAAAGGAQGLDRALVPGDRIAFGGRFLSVRATPGHTDGCITLVLDDETLAFTGDALLIRGCGRTDFQQGNARRLYQSVHEQLLTLPDATLLYPGHDYRGLTVTSVGEERRYNPRFGGASSPEDFCGHMAALALPHPKRMMEAVPANLRCGEPESEPPPEPDWAPLTWAFAGLWEIEPQALEELATRPQLVDVREPHEFNGPLGHLAGSRLVPLGELRNRLDELDPNRPVVLVCRSGARSAQATLQLMNAGWGRVANLTGGLLRWRAQGGAVEGGED